MQVYHIELPKPPIGNKIFLAQMHGFYVLERGPGLWRSMSNTHMGNGSISVYDGIPDDNGNFPAKIKEVKVQEDGRYLILPDYFVDGNGNTIDPKTILDKNGRMIFNASPPILGMWMFDAYCAHGITLALNDSGQSGSHAPCVTITWMPKIEQQRQIENAR